MILCASNPQLLCKELWFQEELLGMLGMQDADGETALMKLLSSECAGKVNFAAPAIQQLLESELDIMSYANQTALMHLCYGSPQLLGCEWARELVEKLSGRRDKDGHTALLRLLQSVHVYNTDFDSSNFKILWENEKNIRIYNNWTILMQICAYSSTLLENEIWFIHEI